MPSPISISSGLWAKRRGPIGRLVCCTSVPFSSWTISRLAPPRSPIMPVAWGISASTPEADRRASSSPLMMRTGKPQSRSTAAANSGPSAASRTAAVAKALISITFMAWVSAAKRWTLSSARAAPSGLRRPVEFRPRPRPHRTFSLNTGIGARLAAS